MMNTRRTPAGTSKQTTPTSRTPASQRDTPATTAVSNTDNEPDHAHLTDSLTSLSKESKTFVKIVKTIILKQFRTEMQTREEIIKTVFTNFTTKKLHPRIPH